jgi:hypothetical protein
VERVATQSGASGEMVLGFSSFGRCGSHFDPAMNPLGRRMLIRRSSNEQCAQWTVGHVTANDKKHALNRNYRTRWRACIVGHGPQKVAGQIVLLCYFSVEHCFNSFCPNFGQILSRFFYSKLSNQFFFRNSEVTEIILKSVKFMNFYSYSAANS